MVQQLKGDRAACTELVPNGRDEGKESVYLLARSPCSSYDSARARQCVREGVCVFDGTLSQLRAHIDGSVGQRHDRHESKPDPPPD